MDSIDNSMKMASESSIDKDVNISLESVLETNGELPEKMQIRRPTCLDAQTFKMENISVVGQFNKQIILVVVPSEDGPILHGFDQHAVHERIRLEEILRSVVEYPNRIRQRKLYPPFEFECNTISLIKDIKQYREQLFSHCSLNLDTYTTQITGHPERTVIVVRHIPACFTSYYHVTLMKRCILDAIRYVKKLDNSPDNEEQRRSMFPYLLNHVRSRACHGAIRFGEALSRQNSKHMIHGLSKCQQQFRCAHGRVLCKPLCRIPVNEEKLDLGRKQHEFIREFGNIQTQLISKY